ncbi:MAG: hypothetical protein EZS28_006676 [Streblomastix strix]|uniref:Uncharacterized protein n=1 Tax=Streblomastix strix TaxID=222440 RepID=A0A5J4WSB8_9EUKA|nr:MAG: hypothetical protein EZS28_006676 [Streblomastix strix]
MRPILSPDQLRLNITKTFGEHICTRVIHALGQNIRTNFKDQTCFIWSEVICKYCQFGEWRKMNVTKQTIQTYVSQVVEHTLGRPTKIVHALVECGAQDWPDAEPRLMLVLSTALSNQCYYKVKRDGKLNTIVPCIGLSRWRCILLLITQQKTIEINIFDEELRDSQDKNFTFHPSDFFLRQTMHRYSRSHYEWTICHIKRFADVCCVEEGTLKGKHYPPN